MIPLKITAVLEIGFSAGDAWSPALDSIIAYYHLQENLGNAEFRLQQSQNMQTTVADLPLLKVEHDGLWWYTCSFPRYDKKHEIQRTFYKRFNVDLCALIDKKVKTIELTKNQFKNYSLAFKEIITDKVEWHVVGNKEKISALLSQCQQIGSHRGKGMGLVKKWLIEESDATSEQLALFSRALPIAYAEENTINGVKMWRGFRPCFRIEENQTLCVMP